MGSNQKGGLVFLIHIADEGANGLLDAGIQADGWFVQKQRQAGG